MKDMSEEKELHDDEREFISMKIKSLESRLKEAEADKDYADARAKEYKERLSQAEAHLGGAVSMLNGANKGIADLEGKLTQASETIQRQHDLLLKQAFEAQERLSHLMDVGGKMAGALKQIVDFDARSWNKRVLGESVIDNGYAEIAKLALAEWDGIKDGGK